MFFGRKNLDARPANQALGDALARVERGEVESGMDSRLVGQIIQLGQSGARLDPAWPHILCLWKPFGNEALRELDRDIHRAFLAAVKVYYRRLHPLQRAKGALGSVER